MPITVELGDVLQFPADVLISTANPWLNLSGGVNGAILAAGGDAIQTELHAHLAKLGTKAVPAGSIVTTSAGSLPFRHILHAVAIDPFYDSSIELVRETLCAALKRADQLGARRVTSPTLATGYGPLSIPQIGTALHGILGDEPLARLSLTFVVRRIERAAELRQAIQTAE